MGSKRGGSTLAGVGLNPGFIAERVATLLTGLCSQLDSVACYEVADASAMPSPEFVFGLNATAKDPLCPESDFVVREGYVDVPRGPGLGVTIDEAALKKNTLLSERVD